MAMIDKRNKLLADKIKEVLKNKSPNTQEAKIKNIPKILPKLENKKIETKKIQEEIKKITKDIQKIDKPEIKEKALPDITKKQIEGKEVEKPTEKIDKPEIKEKALPPLPKKTEIKEPDKDLKEKKLDTKIQKKEIVSTEEKKEIKKEKAIIEEETPKGKIIDSYKLNIDNASIDIKIIKTDQWTIYHLLVPKLGIETEALLDEIRTELITAVSISIGEIADKKAASRVKTKFISYAHSLLK